MTSRLPAGAALQDAWLVFAPGAPHPPTTGVFDRGQWPQGPHCRDYVFVTADLAGRIAQVAVDAATEQSNHQPESL